MAQSLLERVTSMFSKSERPADEWGDTWPPDEVKSQWDEIQSNRMRYENKREMIIRMHPSTAMSEEMRETFVPVPFARELCRFSSSILFPETPKIKMTAQKDLCDTIIRVVDFGRFCVRGGVKAACEGRIGIRIVNDPEIADVPILTIVPGDQIIWDVRHGDYIVGGVVIITRESKGQGRDSGKTYRLFEAHSKGSIDRQLYESANRDFLGRKVPLSAYAEFKELPDHVDTGLNVATLVPWDNVPGAESDMFGMGSMFDELNEAETWLLDAARKCVPRLFVDRALIDSGGRAFIKGLIPTGRGGIAPSFGSDPSKMITLVNPNFNAQQHIQFIAHSLQILVTCAGYAPMTWGIQGQTANVTRAVSGYAMKLAQLRTLLTRANKEHMALQALGWALAISMAWKLNEPDPLTLLPVIELGDGLPSDPLDGAQEVLFLSQAAAASTEELVRTVHPTWTPIEVEAEVARIHEMQAYVANLGAVGNGTGPLASGILADMVRARAGGGDPESTAGAGTDDTAEGTLG